MRFPHTALVPGTFVASAHSMVSHRDSCSSLEHGADYTVDAVAIDAGALNITGLSGLNAFKFCRVEGKLPYGSNDTLSFEVWLPEEANYKGRYLSVGNGGFAGSIDYAAMLTNLNAGFAVGGSDSGHRESENGSNKPGSYIPFLNSHAETTSWIRDSVAMFTKPAKELTTKYYQRAPNKMYFSGCSTGGAQGFALAQYYPTMFDGIFAGSAGNYYTHLILSFLFNGLLANKPDAFLDQAALNLTRNAAIQQCDALDGLRDGIIQDPAKCNFSVQSLACSDDNVAVANSRTPCLSPAQVETANAIYAGPGREVYPGFAPGSESEWILQEDELYLAYAVPILQNLVFNNLSYNYKTFDFESDVDVVDKIAGPLITAISPDLEAFNARGGKLIATQGWADPFNSPFWPIKHRKDAQKIFGQKGLDKFWRLFMVPGGGHCGSASTYPTVPGTWHTIDALVPWVEEDRAPEYVLASEPADGTNTTKRLCPYPQQAVYSGGPIDQYSSFACA